MFDNDNDVDRTPVWQRLQDELRENPKLCGLCITQWRVGGPWLVRIKHREQNIWIVAKRRDFGDALRSLQAKVERAERGPRGTRVGLSYWIPFPLQRWRTHG